ncbi:MULTISPECIES: type II toxin-antitoxin system VapC family toxin [Caballeronia]|uniref:Ribonuclease VapC n=1 Tax=Caballeronia novacaledonica TaxID=1544861 RepID=A0AA37I5W9_9BURK|nr:MULTISPECIES: type II toxin-antitoxin system VapC family toxin [Caballeronia]MDR5741677.1 type II toxin-antitoxin system VapC family toxin [Caballeronia sp. LZ029]GJH23119.1 type II toxin-antitoxin system VapC family toxin [Caballeronia novacaledonica]
MFLADTNVISETRREERANEGVRAFFDGAERRNEGVFLSVVTVGELRRGVDSLRLKGDARQAANVEAWLKRVLRRYEGKIVPVDRNIGDLWGRLRARHPEPAVDRLIAATALAHGLTVVTRNVRDFERVGVKMLNPFD